MNDVFLTYLQRERARLEEAMAAARGRSAAHEAERLAQLRRVTEAEIARWSADLADEQAGGRIAA
jgi:hypothetical protein